MKKEEMETILRYDAVDNCWHAWSSVAKHISSMQKRGWTLLEEREGCASLQAPSHAVKLCSAKKSTRKPMSEDQKEVMRKRLADARETKKIQS